MDNRIFELTTDQLPEAVSAMRAGDRVILSGTVYTSRDAAHKKLFELLDKGPPPALTACP